MRVQRVAVTGAGGKTGRAILRALLGEGLDARAIVRDPGRADDLTDLGDVEVAVADQRDTDELSEALDGCDALYHLAPNVSSDEVLMGEAVIEACHRRDVARVLYHSVVAPYEPSMPHHADKGRVEARLAATDLAWTILRPNAYLQNLDAYLDELRAGRYRVPYGSEHGLALVDLREVAEVAARCFAGGFDGAIGATWELSGPAEVTPEDVARAASAVLGRPVIAERQDPEAWAEQAEAAGRLEDEARRRLLLMFRHYDKAGSPGDPTTLRDLLGREPNGLESYLAEVLAGSGTRG